MSEYKGSTKCPICTMTIWGKDIKDAEKKLGIHVRFEHKEDNDTIDE